MIDIFEGETKRRAINDPVHSHIRLTELENDLLRLPALNRLHNVRSLSLANLVFPGATATRFSHSLGTLHLASRISEQMIQCCQKRELTGDLFPWMKGDERELARVVQAVRLAGLLHDLGHGPFSHSTEIFMASSLKTRPTEVEEYKRMFQREVNGGREYVHEYYSIKMIQKIFKEEVFQSNHLSIQPEDISCLLSLDSSTSEIFSTPASLRLFRRVISSQIDADRMDYLMRDSLYTGAGFGGIDAERLISNMDVVRSDNGEILQVFNEKAIGNIENFIDARYKMYKWVVRHHLMMAIDQLLRLAIFDLIKKGMLKLEDFHWTRFVDAMMSDSDVISATERGFVENNPYCKSLFDRRYAPVSLLKGRVEDYKVFEKGLVERLGGKNTPAEVDSAISSFVKQYNSFLGDLAKDGPRTLNVQGKDVILLATYVSETPLRSADKERNILIYDGREAMELTSHSSYFNSLNNEWNNFRPYYFAYFGKNVPRTEFGDEDNKIRILAELSDMIAGTMRSK